MVQIMAFWKRFGTGGKERAGRLRRTVGWRSAVTGLLVIAVLMGAGAVRRPLAFGYSGFPGNSSSVPGHASWTYWNTAFQLEPGATYTYDLRHVERRGASSNRGRAHGRTIQGELNLELDARDSNKVRFWYRVDGVHGNGTAFNSPEAVVGAITLAALSGTDELSSDALQLLLAPFHWVRWHSLFVESAMRRGVVWEVFEHPPHRFSVRHIHSTHGERRYTGEVTRGKQTVLELTLDVNRPLPLEIVRVVDSKRYEAELRVSLGRGILR